MEAFFRSSSDSSTPEYALAADFPLLDQLKNLLVKYDRVFKPSAQPMDCEPMRVELIEGAHRGSSAAEAAIVPLPA